jgi:hypothetical protein
MHDHDQSAPFLYSFTSFALFTSSSLQQEKYGPRGVTWADFLQMASAVAVETAGGPKLAMKYGRVDAEAEENCPPAGRYLFLFLGIEKTNIMLNPCFEM